MIIGNGVDIVDIERFKRIINRSQRFITRNYTENEIKLFEEKNMKAETIAANFAAKEAFSKAVGTGFRGFNLKDIEVLRNEVGKPYIQLYGGALKEFSKNEGKVIHVSISHSAKNAVAFVILEG